MDIKAKIDEIADKIKNDPNFASEFQTDPVKAVEKLIGINLPNAEINKIIDGIQAKINVDGIKDKVGGIFGKLGH